MNWPPEETANKRGGAALVTGAAGFIGAPLTKALLARDYNVTAFDLRSVPVDHPRLRQVIGDVRDRQALAGLAGKYDVVFHLAANTENRPGRAGRWDDYEITVGGTVALLEGLCADPPAVVVLTSTQLVYGPTAAAVEEMTAVRPATLFAAAKAAAEAFLCAYTQRTGTRGVACRLANVVGPRARRGVISDLVGQLREDPSKLKVLGDGRQRRSFVHVDDCVSALLTSAGGAAGGWSALNVSNTDSITVAEVAGIVAQCCPQVVAELQFEGGSSWQGDATALHPDPARLLALGWRPSHTSAEAVRATARGMFGLEDPPKEPSAASARSLQPQDD